MTDVPVRVALVAALKGWKRHAAALLLIALAYGAASMLSSQVALYAAALVAFTTWMAWFVFTGVEFLRVLGV
ncbi:hypothetical protein BRC81_14770 [Halobacteriales archaeon QS_1_68_20]|nr:MAG: hypothetical protein BRC81_14770 [Halobacteriales archaeon QS_1_68_20]